MLSALTKTNETPQFAGMTAEPIITDNEINLASTTLPTAATQPIHNIFKTTSDIEENINFNNLLSTSNFIAAQATPLANPIPPNSSFS